MKKKRLNESSFLSSLNISELSWLSLFKNDELIFKILTEKKKKQGLTTEIVG
ncbi:MAG: hypothetical protein ACTSU4_13485 [Promethearchaeota archaeon]